MKKTLIFILTILTLVSVLALPAFATDSSEDSAASVDNNSAEVSVPEPDIDMPEELPPVKPDHDKTEQGGKPMMPDDGKHNEGKPGAPEENIPTIGATDESSEEPSAENSETVADGDINITFTTDNIGTSLEHMGLGMLGVILVLGLIAVVVFVLNRVFKPKA